MLRHRPRRLVVVLGLLSLLVAGVVVVATSDAAPKTKRLHGHMENISNSPPRPETCCRRRPASARASTAKGDIKGDGNRLRRHVPATQDTPSFSKAHTIDPHEEGRPDVHRGGALRSRRAPITPSWTSASSPAAPGIYAGATGYIQEVGTFDFAANVGELEYYGKITYAGVADDSTTTDVTARQRSPRPRRAAGSAPTRESTYAVSASLTRYATTTATITSGVTASPALAVEQARDHHRRERQPQHRDAHRAGQRRDGLRLGVAGQVRRP